MSFKECIVILYDLPSTHADNRSLAFAYCINCRFSSTCRTETKRCRLITLICPVVVTVVAIYPHWRSNAVNEVGRSMLSTTCDGHTGLQTTKTTTFRFRDKAKGRTLILRDMNLFKTQRHLVKRG